ncbi:MAG TPA: GAF and ANTAR domain-containing protein [Pseudonocardia sp.]|jgi:hypothetical protein
MPDDTVSAALLAIARDVDDDRALARLICRACVDGLGVDGAALSLLTAQVGRHTLHATDATAELLEELQFTLNEGACIEAATTGSPVLVSDLRERGASARWPVFTAAVIERTEVRALFALPLQWGTTNLGVIDLYRRVPEGLNDTERRDAIGAADTATLMMLTLRTDPPDRGGARPEDQSWLDPAVASRAEIHQATGMVLMQLDVGADAALARMRAHAFVEGRLLIEVARDVVARRLLFTPDMD